MQRITLFAVCSTLLGCGRPLEPITSCDAIGNARPLCGWQNPEDLDWLPDDRHVLVSEYGGMGGELPGTLASLDLQTDERVVLFDGSDQDGPGEWGDAACPGAPGAEFSPHGIHVSQRADGAWQALAVNHGGRESVELFEVVEGPALEWRGCVLAPERSLLNDVVASPDGGFLVTHMMTRRKGVGQMTAYLNASWFDKGGHVYRWTPDDGFDVLPESEGGLANGIQISADGQSVFVAYSAAGEIRELDRQTGELLATHEDLDPIDNLTWGPDGRLLAATSLAKTRVMMKCSKIEEGVCPGEHAIVAIDIDTSDREDLYIGGPGTPGGTGTTGLIAQDGDLLIGTFAGDRIVRVELP